MSTTSAQIWVERIRALIDDAPSDLTKLELMTALDEIVEHAFSALDGVKDELYSADGEHARS